MKIWSIILSLYFVLLGFMPCADREQKHTKGNDTESAEHRHEASDHFDLCTPFCHCSCCGANIAFFEHQVILPFVNSIPIERKYPQLIINLSNSYTSFWQPPKNYFSL